jgi:hypothetical protein
MKPKQPKTGIIAKQQRQILELEAQLAHSYHFAAATVDKASGNYLMASGVLVQLTGVGGKEIMCPIMIKDGLSLETVAALKADIIRSYDLATMFKP